MPSESLVGARRVEGRIWMALLLYVAIGILAAYRVSGPPPHSRDSSQVSAVRAMQTLDMLLGDPEQSHPAGSRENELFRVRLLGALDELGAKTIQLPFEPMPLEQARRTGRLGEKESFVAPTVNIIAHIPGLPRSRPVVVATHYDACRTAPGAGDAGQCVAAVLETLHHLKQAPLQHEFWCVFTDSEEFAMHGARALVDRDDLPWGDARPIVINLDARGDQGAVLLYETHVNNLAAMRLAADALADPKLSTSLMVNVYRFLPNATDFTIFQKAGWIGWNLAVIGGAERYHTPDDSLENLSMRSLQHFAAHTSRLLKRLDQLDDSQFDALSHSQPAVFFDWLGIVLLVYPASWNWWQWIILAVAWAILYAMRRSSIRLSRVFTALGMASAIVALCACIGMMLASALRAADVLPRPFVRYDEWISLLYAAVGMLLTGFSARWLAMRANRTEICLGLCMFLLLLAIAANVRVPGAAYLLLWPATCMMVVVVVDQFGFVGRTGRAARIGLGGRIDSPRVGILACVVPAVLYAPTYVLLVDALGARAGLAITAFVGLILLPVCVAAAEPNSGIERGS